MSTPKISRQYIGWSAPFPAPSRSIPLLCNIDTFFISALLLFALEHI